MPGKLAAIGANVVALGSVLSGKTLIACGLRRPPEGWRRTVGILLRSEPTRFALSAFGLNAPGGTDSQLAARLREYLDGQPDAHFRLGWRDVVTIRQRTPRSTSCCCGSHPPARYRASSPPSRVMHPRPTIVVRTAPRSAVPSCGVQPHPAVAGVRAAARDRERGHRFLCAPAAVRPRRGSSRPTFARDARSVLGSCPS